MNNLDNLIRENINNLSSGEINNTKILLVLIGILCFLAVVLLVLGFRFRDFSLVLIGIMMLILFPFCEIDIWHKINFNVKDVDVKQEYNITLEEKDKTIELLYNENKESSKYIKQNYIKDKFKIVFSKDKEEHYYVYFDEKVKDKKAITIEEIQQFFRTNVDYSYYDSLEKFKLKDITEKEDKKHYTENKSYEEDNIEQLEKKLNELKEKKKVSNKKEIKKNNVEQLQKELNEIQKKIDKEKENE